MWKFKRGGDKRGDGDTAVAERPQSKTAAGGFQGSEAELGAEIERLAAQNRDSPARDTERKLLTLRHEAGIRALGTNGHTPQHPEPDASLPEGDPLPEFTPADLTPELVRAAVLRDGCILIRGLVPRDRALAFAEQIDRSFDEREKFIEGQAPAEGYYEEMEPDARYKDSLEVRPWIREGGGVLAVDAPMLMAEMVELFQQAGLPRLVEGYLGERPLISMQKTTLRKADPSVAGAWHQDGKFMGEVRALNLWLSLSRCGDESPGLDIVPRRLDHFIEAQTGEAMLDFQVSRALAEEAAGDKGVQRPIFEPGDALLFDDMFLHATGSDPAMPKPRYAVENWFFGASGFPVEYGPVAV